MKVDDGTILEGGARHRTVSRHVHVSLVPRLFEVFIAFAQPKKAGKSGNEAIVLNC